MNSDKPSEFAIGCSKRAVETIFLQPEQSDTIVVNDSLTKFHDYIKSEYGKDLIYFSIYVQSGLPLESAGSFIISCFILSKILALP